MSWWRLLSRTLWHFRGSNLAILLGVAAAAAVMTGALIVGDSVRGSLLALSEARLQKVRYVIAGSRFFREEWAAEIAGHPDFASSFEACVTGLTLRGSVEKPGARPGTIASRAGQVQVYGVNESWKQLARDGVGLGLAGNEIVISTRLATALGVAAGDEVLMTLEMPTSIPKDSLLGEKDETSRQIPLVVKTVLPESSSFGQFGLVPNQQVPLSAFVDLSLLQDRLDLSAARATRRSAARVGRVNTLFVVPRTGVNEAAALDQLQAIAKATWRLGDLMVRITQQTRRQYLSLESDMMVLEDDLVQSSIAAAESLGWQAAPALIYLVNEVTAGKGEAAYSMYSAVCGLEPGSLQPGGTGPLAGFEFVGEPPTGDLKPDEMLINSWLAEDLKAKVGDRIDVKYHVSGSRGELPEVSRSFRLAGILSLENGAANDQGLTPEVPGITDAASLADWDQPFPMQMSRITSRDDLYWDDYKSTPKMFIRLDVAREMFRNRYGATTSVRAALPSGKAIDAAASAEWERVFLSRLQPDKFGLAFQDIFAEGRKAAGGTTDFGGLFIGFSFFLIVAAAILVALLFRLAVERRPAQIGLLLAVGTPFPVVRRFLLTEACLLTIAGVILGLTAATGYAMLMVYGLTTWWVGAIGTRFLQVHLHPATLLLGAAISMPVALLAMASGLRGLRRVCERSLLAGASELRESPELKARRRRTSLRLFLITGGCSLALAVLGVAGLLPDREAFGGFSIRVVAFFLSGFLGLFAGQSGFAAWLATPATEGLRGRGLMAAIRLGFRNAARQRLRSVLTVGMIATATFLIVAIAAGKKDPAVETPLLDSGNGGYTLVGETNVPLLYDVASTSGRIQYNLDDPESRMMWSRIRAITPFRLNPGENASCLNVYQTSQPTILGVPHDQMARGGFKFVGASGNPWELLTKSDPDGIVPVFGDLNTLQYSLHVGPGSVIELRDGRDQPFKARIAGMLDSSVFQGVLLMSETEFQSRFPERAGFQYLLVDVAEADSREVSDWLESKFAGLDLDRVGDRLAGFLAVQNTYLSTFQALGGLGLILGTLGLGTILLRNVLERRSELALLKAVGYGPAAITAMILAENSLLLMAGLGLGTIAALVAMSPHLLTSGANVAWLPLLGQLLLVAGIGTLAAVAAVRMAERLPIVRTLRAQ